MERNNLIDAEKNILMRSKTKPSLRLVVLGHVDAGKTATLSRLLEKLDKINNIAQPCEMELNLTSKDLWNKYSMPRHNDSPNLTILKLESYKRTLTFFDASGFRDYIKNMCAGLNQANAGLLVVAAAPGEFEAGFSLHGQTREHILLANTMGVNQILVVINKMDCVNYSQARYEEIKQELSRFVKKVGYQPDDVTFVPVSCTRDENFDGSTNASMSWYKGHTLLEALDNLKVPQPPVDRPLRVTIHGVFNIKDVGTVVVGRVETGVLKVNDRIVIAPGQVLGEVKSIEVNNTKINQAYPGDNVGIHIEGISVKNVRSGYVIGHADREPPVEVIDFTAQIIMVYHPGEIREGYSPVIDCNTHAHVACKFAEFLVKYDKKTGNALESGDNLKLLKRGDKTLIRMVPLKPMVVEPFSEFAALGRISIRDMRLVVGYGTVISVNKKQI